MYLQLVPIIAPVFLCASIGYVWAKSGIPFEREFLTRIIMNIGTPCLILNGIANLDFEPAEFMRILVAAFALLTACAVIGSIVLKLFDQPQRSFLPPIVFSNTGNLGLPLCYFSFGDEGLGLGVAVYLIYSVVMFVLMPLFQGREPAWKTLIATPMIYSALIGVALLTTDTAMPLTLANTVGLLAGLAIPLMLLALGHSLATFRITQPGRAFGIALLRLVPGLLIGILIVELFSLDGVMRGVIIIQSAMPLAVFNYLLAARYDRHPDEVAGAILISTLISFVTLPLLILFALGEIGMG